MILRNSEIKMLDHTNTANAAIPIPNAPTKLVVVAKVGQVPSTNTNTGFSFKRPFHRVAQQLFSFTCYTPSKILTDSNARRMAFL